MPSLSQHYSSTSHKLLLMGDSGTGKTGALASLARSGFNLRIADFDKGTDILYNLLREEKEPFSRVNYIPFEDEFIATPNGAQLIPKAALAWTTFIKALSKWEDLGRVEDWGEKDILIVDSLNFAGKAALRHIQQLNGRLANPLQIQDFFSAQQLVENLCAKLYTTSIKCNVICITHVREIGKREDIVDDKGRVKSIELSDTIKGFPETGTGRALSPTIGRYFNAVLLTDIEGSGSGTRRLIRTVPFQNIGLKNSSPKKVKATYPIETGLASYFADVRAP